MRTDTPKPITLSDYRPPAYRIETIDLDFDLQPKTTRVKARLVVKREGDHDAPLVLDGVRLSLISAAIDGRVLDQTDYEVGDSHLTISAVPAAFTLETEVEIDPEGNKALEGLYMSGGRFCKLKGFARSPTSPIDRTSLPAIPCGLRRTRPIIACCRTAI
jgi:aminopeptidase N